MEHTIKTSAIILAAGYGRRMESRVAKQFMSLLGFPVLYYSLKAFEQSLIDEIVVVVGTGEESFCQEEIINKYQIDKVSKIVTGGTERYFSAYNGIKATNHPDYVLIHDGARPLVTSTMINECIECVQVKKACIVGMPVKDTIKMADKNNIVMSTPDRDSLWTVQTPQCFEYDLINKAYQMLFQQEVKNITDDAMVLEMMMHYPVALIKGSYQNMKITTPEDLQIAELLINTHINNC